MDQSILPHLSQGQKDGHTHQISPQFPFIFLLPSQTPELLLFPSPCPMRPKFLVWILRDSHPPTRGLEKRSRSQEKAYAALQPPWGWGEAMDCPGAGPALSGLSLACVHSGPAPTSQMTLALQVPRPGSKGLALVPWVRLLVPMLVELLRARGRSGSSRRCHCRHFF